MSIPAPYSEVYLAGDGTTTVFAFGTNFKPISAGLVKCSVYLSDGYEVIPTYTVDMEGKFITISALTLPDSTVLTAPPAGSTVRIYRDMPEEQDITASQLQAFTAKQLEVALDAIVAMIQEVSYTTDHKTVRLTEPQRDIALQELGALEDEHLIYWDNTARKLVVTNYPQQDVVRCVNGLFFRLRADPDTQEPYLQWSTDESDWHSINIDAVELQAQGAYALAGDAYTLAYATRGELNTHKGDHGNPHETSMNNLIDTNFNNLTSGQFLQFNGVYWKNVNYTAVYAWGGIVGDILDQADLMAEFNKKLNLSGGTLTGDLAFRYSTSYPVLRIIQSGQNTNHLRFINNSYASQSISFDLSQAAIHPLTTGRGHLGTSNIHFGDAYIDKVYTGFINNGYDIAVPVTNGADTLALKSEVDLAANSGSQLYSTGVWYAKMYAVSTVPTGAQYDGTNYADFSQVDADNNPVIKIYTGASGAWTLTDTITPPAEYNGYIWVTSKIWDIVEQTGQHGGEVLWDHTHKTFTPYPRIIDVDLTNYLQNTATGTNSLTILGDATSASTALNIGPYSTAEGAYSLAIGPGSGSAHRVRATHANAMAIGYDALALAIDAIQLGAGQATTQGRFKVWNHTMLDKNTGKIPIARLGDDTSMTQGNVLTLDSNGAAVWQAPGGSGLNVGDIFYTMRNDNELNGAVECNGATYNTTDFAGAQSIGALLTAGKVPYLSLADYEYYLGLNGSVGEFGWDGGSSFRVPTLTDIFIETGSAAQAGVYVAPGAPNIKGSVSVQQGGSVGLFVASSGCITLKNQVANQKGGTTSAQSYQTAEVDASVSSALYGASNTIQPQAMRYRAMVQLATAATDEALETCTGVLADVATLKSHEVIAFQAPTAGNNYTWYRKYADGWVEQGGMNITVTTAVQTWTLPITMADTHYAVQFCKGNDNGNYAYAFPDTASTIKYKANTGSNQTNCAFVICGMAA